MAAVGEIIRSAPGVIKRHAALALFILSFAVIPPQANAQTPSFTPVCDRTPQVRDEIEMIVGEPCRDIDGSELASITFVFLHNKRITSLLPGDFSGMSSLEDLSLSSNQLTSLPAGIFSGLSSLKDLELSFNQIADLDAGVLSGLGSLEEVSFSFNPLTSLPAGIFNGLTSLNTLWLFRLQIETLPAGIFNGLGSLRLLYMGSGLFASLPDDIFNGLTSLETLSLFRNSLNDVPRSVGGIVSLRTLLLQGNQIDAAGLPAGIFNRLVFLENLKLSSNQLRSLPETTFNGLSRLNNLDLSGNQLNGLPEGIFRGLGSLTNLNLNSNSISGLPESVFNGLTSLLTLQLSSNEISSLPEGILSGLNSLLLFTIANNGIGSLPRMIFRDTVLLNRAFRSFRSYRFNPWNFAISANDLTVTESGGRTAEVTVTMTEPLPYDLTLQVSTADGTAVEGEDYTAPDSTLTIAEGETSGAVSVPILEDGIAEGRETFELTVSEGPLIFSSGAFAPTSATATIAIGGASVIVEPAEVRTSENGSGDTFTVTLASPPAADVEITVTSADTGEGVVSSGGASGETTTLIFAPSAWDTEQTVTVTGVDDGIADGDVEYAITLEASSAGDPDYVIADAATVTATNRDNEVALAMAGVEVSEADGFATVVVSLNSPVFGGFTVDVSTTDGTAVAGEDYTAVSGATLTFAGNAGETQNFTVSVTRDDVTEGNETFTVSLFNLLGAALAVDTRDTATVTIINTLRPALTMADVEVSEADGFATVVVSLNSPVSGGFIVDVSTADGTAVAGEDYTAVSGETLRFIGSAGETQTFIVSVTDDVIEEGNKTFTVSLFNLLGAALAVDTSDTATITIINAPRFTRDMRKTAHRKTVGVLSRAMAESALGVIGRRLNPTPLRALSVKVTGHSALPADLENGNWRSVVAEKIQTGMEEFENGGKLLNIDSLVTGTIRQSNFVVPLGGGERSVAVWGAGGGLTVNGDPEDNGLRTDYDGKLFNALVGIDGVVIPNWRIGLALGYGKGELDYKAAANGVEVSGDVKKFMVSVYPYLSWNTADGLSVWLMGGYGLGDYDISEVTQRDSIRWNRVDASGWMAAVGAEKVFSSVNDWDFALRAKGLWSRVELDGSVTDGIALPALTSTNWRARFESETGLILRIGERDTVRPYGLLSLRWDGGDVPGDDSIFFDVGGGVRLRMRGAFLFDISFYTQALDGDTEERSAVAVGGIFFDIGQDGKGFYSSLERASGTDFKSSWKRYGFNEEAGIRRDIRPDTEFEVGYGWEALKTYARSLFEDEGRSHKVGFDFGFESVDLNLEAGYAENTGEREATLRARTKF